MMIISRLSIFIEGFILPVKLDVFLYYPLVVWSFGGSDGAGRLGSGHAGEDVFLQHLHSLAHGLDLLVVVEAD